MAGQGGDAFGTGIFCGSTVKKPYDNREFRLRMKPVNILGISAFYHDSAACLVRDGEIVAAAQEERFTRVKHDPAFPSRPCPTAFAKGASLRRTSITWLSMTSPS